MGQVCSAAKCCLLVSLPASSHLWLRHLQWPHVSSWIVLLLRKPLSKHLSSVVPQGQFTEITFFQRNTQEQNHQNGKYWKG